MVFVTPLYFGIAHIHHFYEFVLTHPELPLLPAIIRTIVQFSYTSIFGFLASFIFLRTGSLYAVIVAHMFCNWMGLPRFWGRVRVQASEPIGPSRPKKDDEDPLQKAEPSKKAKQADTALLWTAAYYILLVAGAYGFWKSLRPLTESGEQALAYFDA
jgi:prenyl protein peptidase